MVSLAIVFLPNDEWKPRSYSVAKSETSQKYQLVGLLVHGDKPKTFKDNFSLPKFTSPLVGKFLKPLCAAYSELVSAYTANNQAELRAAVNKHQEVFISDNNMGLV